MSKYDLSGLCMTYSMRFELAKSKKQIENTLKCLKEELKNIKSKDIVEEDD